LSRYMKNSPLNKLITTNNSKPTKIIFISSPACAMNHNRAQNGQS
jgi:hypothetical protein